MKRGDAAMTGDPRRGGLARLVGSALRPSPGAARAVPFTLYCVLAPRLKERRFKLRYGGRFEAYRRRVPYFVPRFRSKPPPR